MYIYQIGYIFIFNKCKFIFWFEFSIQLLKIDRLFVANITKLAWIQGYKCSCYLKQYIYLVAT